MLFRQKVPENPKDAQVAAPLMQAYEELRYKLFIILHIAPMEKEMLSGWR